LQNFHALENLKSKRFSNIKKRNEEFFSKLFSLKKMPVSSWFRVSLDFLSVQLMTISNLMQKKTS